jgi:hypothetical protein
MQNIHVVSRPKFPILSNGALVFAVVSNSMYKKMDKTSHQNCASIQAEFLA